MGASLLALAKSIYYTILDKTVEKKLHTWGAFFLNFVADRFFPSPLPLEAVLLGLQKKAGSLSICRKQLGEGVFFTQSRLFGNSFVSLGSAH